MRSKVRRKSKRTIEKVTANERGSDRNQIARERKKERERQGQNPALSIREGSQERNIKKIFAVNCEDGNTERYRLGYSFKFCHQILKQTLI